MTLKFGNVVRIWPGINVCVTEVDGDCITVQWVDAHGKPCTKVVDPSKILAFVRANAW